MTLALFARLRAVALAACAWSLATSSAHATNVLGYPDFNGDGKSDLVWRDKLSEFAAVWLMDGTTHFAEGGLFWAYGYDFTLADADFNGDGKTDFYWRGLVFPFAEPSSVVAVMNGVVVTGTLVERFVGATPDLDGDGKSDLALVDAYWGVGGRMLRLQLMDGLDAKVAKSYALPPIWFPWSAAGSRVPRSTSTATAGTICCSSRPSAPVMRSGSWTDLG